MAYCTLADIKKDLPIEQLVALIDDKGESYENSVTVEMEAIVTNAITNADAIIDDFCRGKYTLPFATVPQTIKKLSVDIAVFFISSRVKSLDAEDMRRVIYEDAIQYLRRIASGEVSLAVVPATEPEVLVPIQTNKTAADRMFPSSELAKF